jgi:hypothetical protein
VSAKDEYPQTMTNATGPTKQCRGCQQAVAVFTDAHGVDRYIKHDNANGWGWDCLSGGMPV